MGQHVVDVGAQLAKLLGSDDALEDVEAVGPIRVEDFRQELAVGTGADRSAIAQRVGAGFGAPAVVAHGALVIERAERAGGGGDGHGGAPDECRLAKEGVGQR